MAVDEAERIHALLMLQRAVGEGVISLAEYESRSETLVLGGADDVARATEGLTVPPTPAVTYQGRGTASLRGAYTASLRVEAAAWALVSVVNLVVWVAIAATVGPIYFWPVWVIGPWGAVLGFRELIDRRMRVARQP